MSNDTFAPTLYLKEGCPFCLKVRLFMLESGLLDDVQQRMFSPGSAEEQAIRAELEPKIEKVSFPAAQIEPGRYITEFDAIIAHFAQKAGRETSSLPIFSTYADTVLPNLLKLYRENTELKSKLN